ncbi:MAG: hypothetical protein IPP07_05955 [Holophagales bacterium]|nr:hypothetical protein [Holophagales bacterium]
MRRFRSVFVAAALLVLGLYARQVYSADFYSFGFYKQWLDANGEIIGEAYKPCLEDNAEAYTWGTRVGQATIVERWQCDPQAMTTPDACEVWWYRQRADGSGFWVFMVTPCGL